MARRVVRLVIFDCDGVLVDSERLVSRVEAEFFSTLGAAYDPDEVRTLFKGKTVEQVAAALEHRIGRALSPAFVYDWATAVALAFVQELRSVPGVEDLLADLQHAGTALCVASQSPLTRVELSLRVTGLDRYFGGRVFTSSSVRNPKPAPDLFLFAADRMGATPDETVVIEDSLSGVVAARAAGMRVFGYAADEDAGAFERAGATVFYSMNDLRLDGRLLQNAV